ncbi:MULTISPECIES: AIR synthase-related protein [Aminobacterium]|uniref:AIR synthase-related protein n=1 Tax=Aminobacterium TaxID=81466 RepID=UPI001696AFA8|nr:AIR synthase-related protein [Aminobacterium sp. EBM-42]MDD2378909.1 AIR synthase-related protein [Aminobacterium colombiense]MDD3767706.1 AIR synthase-related protein [Aminobacterium colombiense]MDD4265108.1 AIR synthase-related protein [Aminobacterium colombiense]MDD4585711.1 AIR synthase-related protein [Aminobacterium colombiense]NLK30989.1 hydrogenase expression protein [Aminobacterium colombiense]
MEDGLRKLPVGKLPPDILEQHILQFSGASRPDVLVGPGIGEDASLIRFPEGKLLAVSSDPIVGASKGAGTFLVHINANDIACKGGDPAYFIITLIIPVEQGLPFARMIMEEIHHACKKMGIAVIGGHTELTDRYKKPVVVGTMMGQTSYLYRATDICAGDGVIMTKHVGLEGMSILAHDRPDLLKPHLSDAEIQSITSWISSISVLKEAAAVRDLARFMHDPTEGGLFGGLAEICRLSGLNLHLDMEAIPIHPLTRKVGKALGADIYHLISSGVLVVVVPEEKIETALKRLEEKQIPAALIGKIVEEGRGNCELDSKEELWRLLAL